MGLEVPAFKQHAGFFKTRTDRDLHQNRHQDLRIEILVIPLDCLHIVQIDRSRGIFNQIDDTLGAMSVCIDLKDQVRIILIYHGIIRCNNVTLGRVECEWELFKWDISSPFVIICPTRDWQTAVPIRPNRDISRHLVANVAVHIGIDQVLSWGSEIAGGFTELIPVFSPVKLPDGAKDSVWFKCSPSKRNGVRLRQINTHRLVEIFRKIGGIRNDGTMSGVAHSHFHRFSPSHLDGLIDQLHIHPLPVHFILIRVLRINPLDIQILYIRTEICKTPSDAIIVTDHHARHTGKGEPSHFIGTGFALLVAMQPNLIPDGWHLSA